MSRAASGGNLRSNGGTLGRPSDIGAREVRGDRAAIMAEFITSHKRIACLGLSYISPCFYLRFSHADGYLGYLPSTGRQKARHPALRETRSFEEPSNVSFPAKKVDYLGSFICERGKKMKSTLVCPQIRGGYGRGRRWQRRLSSLLGISREEGIPQDLK